MAVETSSPRTPQTQAWLQTIYNRPAEFLGQTVAILNDEKIVLVAPTFRAAREGVARLGLPSGANVTYFHVPQSLPEVCILTLRVRSLKESLWLPLYSVELRGPQGAILQCQMLVDSGADISLISFTSGQELGLHRSDEEVLLTAQGVGGTVAYCLRRLELIIDRVPLHAAVAWCQDAAVDEMILGRKDVFDAFFIEFRQPEKQVAFTPTKTKQASA
ncbi:MAG: hypothetical protein FJ398_27010 [Verrucomicrobia bacterium]|nr:hypothetical protein [Verrucomicrobiota bacterium]